MTSASWEDELTDWEDELDRPDGHPLIATALGVAVIIAVASIAYGTIAVDVRTHIYAALGIATLVAGLVWGVAWFLTVRFAAAIWQFATGAIFWLTALMMVLFALGGNAISLRQDIATMQMIRIDQTGAPAVPSGSPAGPVTKRTMAFYREFLKQDHVRNVIYLRLGIDRIGQTWAVPNQPSLLTDCDRFPRAAPQLAAINATVITAVGRFRGDLRTLIAEPALQTDVFGWVDQTFPTSGPRYQQRIAQAREQLDLAAKMCGILGRHRWKRQGDGFGFTSEADYREYGVVATRWDQLMRDMRSGGTDAGTPPVPRIE
ncbi:hypothetical protein FPZ24_00155 [Sphingomonas panacisoli]|uniref:Uncharacterized protein n=1 Tax=Sphingomonas panacisoli TaxID=1813879 RepID=A0A5B8LDT7_9SPHN|nr:hypothetical protein [Sphingomonas panacisoli]QDZ06076.1 hypothetical protein FPZ24_00155 [Sphingomonas panacisoli]